MAGVFHDGQIQYVRRMWFDNELVMNNDGPTLLTSGTSSTRYEAENGVLAGGASTSTQAECSGGYKVTGLGSGGNVTIHCDVTATDLYEVAVGYTSTVDRTFKVSVNGGATTDLVCPASGGAGLVAVQTITLALTSGANTIKFENAGAAAPDLDYITIAPALSFTDGVDTRSFTGLQTPGRIAPTDPDIAWPVNDEPPVFSDPTGGLAGGGNYSATLAKWGSPQIRIYLGSETQEPDPLIESIKGVGNTSAYRGYAYIVIEGLQLQNGRVPNVTIEFVEGTRACSAILNSLAEMVGLTPANDLDTTALSGLILGDNSGFSPGSYSAITWTGLVNATQTGGGAITKTSGTTGFYNAYAVQGTTVSAGTDASIRFTAGAGTFMIGFSTTATPGSSLPNPYAQVPFAIILNLNANPSQVSKNALQMSLGGSNNTTDIGVWALGDQFQVEIRNGRFNVYQNGLLLGGFIPPPATFPLHPIWIGYATGGGPSAASYATGSNIGSEPIIVDAGALILDSQREASELVEELMTRFQFILPEVDSKIKAVMLNASSDLTLTEAECQAYRGDGLPPKIEISRKNPLTFPKKTIVNYSDPQLDHHANAQVETRLYGPQKGTLNVSLAMVETAANMKKLAAILSSRAEVEGQTYKFTVGPKYKRIHQGTVLTITEGSSTHQVRVTNFRPDLPAGLCEVEAVRQASVFNPTVVTQPIGTEAPIVPIPGATKGVIIDGPLLRAEDAGDGTQPVVYVPMCGRGSGAWPAGLLYKEYPIGSDSYSFLTSSAQPSGIGVTSGALPSVSDPSVWDRTSSLVVGFYSDTQLSSATEAELLANPELNLLAIVNPATGDVEYVQFKTAIPLSTFPINPVDAPGFLAYWEADGLSAGSLSSWPSLGGGPTMSGGVSPTVVADALNGKAVVEFSGSQYLTFTEITTIRTVYLLVKHDQSTSTHRDRFMPILGHGTATDWIGLEGTRLVGAASANVTGGSAYLNATPMAVTKLCKAGEYEVFTFVTSGNTTASQFGNDRGAHFFAGRLAAAALYDQPHLAVTAERVAQYFIQQRALSLPPLVVPDGDSLTADRPTSGNGLFAGNAWPDQMIPMLNATAFGNYDTYDMAVGGQTLANMNSDASTEIDPLFNSDRADNICVVWAGTNDMGIGGGSQSGATTYSRLVTYCQARQAAGWTVLVMVCLKRNDLSNFPNQAALDAFEVQRGIYNTNIRANWATFADVLIDLETLDYFNNTTGAAGADTNMDLTDPNNTIFFNADKIHLNALGQTVVAMAVKAAIEAL